MMVAQSPTGELEVLPGKSAYIYDGNWNQDAYQVSSATGNQAWAALALLELF